MLTDFYSELDEKQLASAFCAAWVTLQGDERQRARGLPLSVSAQLATELRQIVGLSQKDAERFFYGLEDLGGGADGRIARRRESGEASMTTEMARAALSSTAWGSAVNGAPQWFDFAARWWMKIDCLEAAQEAFKTVKRRADPSDPNQVLVEFRKELIAISRRAELSGNTALHLWLQSEAAEAVLAQICHTADANAVKQNLTPANITN